MSGEAGPHQMVPSLDYQDPILASRPGHPARPPDSSLDKGLCFVCAKGTFASWHSQAPQRNPQEIENATRLANALDLDSLEGTALDAWYGVQPQARTLDQFVREDPYGGFWTPLGIVCRYCSGMPGFGHDWRADRYVARCWCGWESVHGERESARRSLRSHRAHPSHAEVTG